MESRDRYKIGGHWIDVEVLHERDGFFKDASTCRWWNKIFIQADLAPSKRESALLHEVIHEIDGQMGIGLDEIQVGSLAECLYQFLVDNDLLK